MGMVIMIIASFLMASALAMADAVKSTDSKPLVLPNFSALAAQAPAKKTSKWTADEGCKVHKNEASAGIETPDDDASTEACIYTKPTQKQ